MPDVSPDFFYVGSDPKTCFMRQATHEVMFPLSEEHLEVCRVLEEKQNEEGHQGVGLAANQLGYTCSIILIEVPDSELLRKLRADFSETFYGIMINPVYKPLSQEKVSDWEACFSVPNMAGFVPRYTHIEYIYKAMDGEERRGEATGFLARVIQHEIDHLRGIPFIDLIGPEDTMTLDEYKAMRAKKISAE